VDRSWGRNSSPGGLRLRRACVAAAELRRIALPPRGFGLFVGGGAVGGGAHGGGGGAHVGDERHPLRPRILRGHRYTLGTDTQDSKGSHARLRARASCTSHDPRQGEVSRIATSNNKNEGQVQSRVYDNSLVTTVKTARNCNRNDIDQKEYITTLIIIHINNKDTFTSHVPTIQRAMKLGMTLLL